MRTEDKKKGRGGAWQPNLRAWQLFASHCPRMIAATVLSQAVTAAGPYLTVWTSARLMDELAGLRRPERLWRLAGWILLVTAVQMLLQSVLKRWQTYERIRAVRLDDRLYLHKLLTMDYAAVDSQKVQDLYSRIRQNENFLGWGFPKALELLEKVSGAVFRILGGAVLSAGLFAARVPSGSALSFLNHPLFAVLLPCTLLLAAALSPACAVLGNAYFGRLNEEMLKGNRYFGFFSEMSKERKRAADLRIYRQQEQICDGYLSEMEKEGFGAKSQFANYARGPMGLWLALSVGTTAVLTGVIYLFVCLKAWAGAFGIGEVTQYVGAVTNLFQGISDLWRSLGELQTNGRFLEKCFAFLDLPDDMYRGSLTTEKRSDRRYEIEFRDVSFRYPGTKQWALRHINLRLRVGSRLAVVGQNGSGKTTFIKLLCRLYDPTEGQILLNGIEVQKYRMEEYQSLFSVVFQDFQLPALQLGQNVAASSQYSKTRADSALAKAGFAERLEEFPNGLDTFLYQELDPSGITVSGGEAQKIAIARALYKDAPFMILDEPTAALDPVAEAEIYARFSEIAGDRTTVYISHRLSSCRFCEEILVFDQGQVVQRGTHESLLAKRDGVYAGLWKAQAGYYTEKEQQSSG